MTPEERKRRDSAANFREHGEVAFHVRGAVRTQCFAIFDRGSEPGPYEMPESERAEPRETVAVQKIEVASLEPDDVIEADGRTVVIDAVIDRDGRYTRGLVRAS